MVEVTGFEPAASCSQSKRATIAPHLDNVPHGTFLFASVNILSNYLAKVNTIFERARLYAPLSSFLYSKIP